VKSPPTEWTMAANPFRSGGSKTRSLKLFLVIPDLPTFEFSIASILETGIPKQ
jgi:hypothetical protein